MAQQSPKKICFLIGAFSPIVNGTITQVSLISEKLAAGGSQILIITGRHNIAQPYWQERNGIEIVRVGPAIGVKRIGKFIRLVPIFVELIKRRKKYDVIIVCDLTVRGILGVVVSKMLSKKCFLRAETNGEMDGSYATLLSDSSSRVKRSVIKFLVGIRNRILLHADGFISISSAITREYLSVGIPSECIIRITNGVDIRRFSPVRNDQKEMMKHKLALPGEKLFVYTGRLSKGKGLEYLMRVWKELASEFHDIHLILVGSGQGYRVSCQDAIMEFIKRNRLESRVTITGNVKNVQEYLQASDFFVFPSQSEALGISLLEAMACELPCIASDVGGIPDIIENDVNGILVPFGDERKLLEAMRRILTDRETASHLGSNGRMKIVENYNIDGLVDRYLSLS